VHRSEPTVRRSDPRYGRESGSSRPSSSGRDYPAGGNGNSGYPAGGGQPSDSRPSSSQPNGRGQAPGNGPSVPYARKAASGSGRHSSPRNGPSSANAPNGSGYRPDSGRPDSGRREEATGWHGAPTSYQDTPNYGGPAAYGGSAGYGSSGRTARPGYYNPDDNVLGLGDESMPGLYRPVRPVGKDGQPVPDELGRFTGRRSRGNDRPPPRRGSPDDPLWKRILIRIWYGRWWRHWSITKVALLMGGTAALVVLALVASFFVVLGNTRVPIKALSQPLTQSSLVYFAGSNGKAVGCFCTADRTVLQQGQIMKSKHLVAAVLAAEDRSFFTEGGISVTGILRAAKADLSGSSSIQGGSTITEQFVKTYYDPSGLGNLTYKEKLKEIFVAIKLAKMKSKWWILTHYLNSIPLGSGANGVQAASETYFGVKAWQLTIPQAAMIGAMIQSPYGYQPKDPNSNGTGLNNTLLDRWVYVLTNMVRDGAITQADETALVPDPSNPSSGLKNFPKIKDKSTSSDWPGYRGYIMNLVANEAAAYYGLPDSVTALGKLGLKIHTTISERLMNDMYGTIRRIKAELAADGTPLPNYVNISTVLEKPGTGKILAFYGGPGFGVKNCKVRRCEVNSILAAEPVGSSFKPYVLTTAVHQGMNVENSVMNSHSPLCIPPDAPAYRHQLSKQTRKCDTPVGYWQFDENSENTSNNLSVVGATATSNDPAFEDLIHRTGVQNVLNMAAKLGVSSYDMEGLTRLFGNNCPKIKHDPNCHPGAINAALGEGSLSAVDQSTVFSTLVSGGTRFTPHVIAYVTQNGHKLTPKGIFKKQVISTAVAADADYALSFDNQTVPGAGAGTGVPNAEWDGRPMIAKTGTLGQGASASEAWFVGAIPQYSLAVGMFTDKPYGTPPEILDGLSGVNGIGGSYGGAWPATIWKTFMSEHFSNLTAEPLPTPNYVGFQKWVQALPVKKKKPKCQPQHGHHHFFFGHGNGGNGNGKNCQGNGNGNGNPNPKPSQPVTPSPPITPNPSPSGSPTPTPTITPNPTPSLTPTPNPSSPVPGGGQAVRPHQQQAPGKKSRVPTPASDAAATWRIAAILPGELTSRIAWTVTTSLA
jgi:membrane peptidoglycan carboxypeptidase